MGKYTSFMQGMSPSGQLLANAILGAGVGAPTGVLAALLKRKLDTDSLSIQSPVEPTRMPMVEGRGEPKKRRRFIPAEKQSVEKAAFDPTVGQAIGVGGGALLSYNLLNRLFNRKDRRHLETELKKREDTLNQLLLQEQSVAAGLPVSTMNTIKRGSDERLVVSALEKIAGQLYDDMEKEGDMKLRELLQRVQNILGIDAAGLRLAAPAFGLGGVSGLLYTRASDPNVSKARAVTNSLRERLTGRDQVMAPMPIRVESDKPVMTPIRPGVSSLGDPTKGRDVLMGI